MESGIVYTETVVHAAPQKYAADAPYQLAIVDLASGGRVTVRILAENSGEPVQIGDAVTFVENRNGVPFYRRTDLAAAPNKTAQPLV